MRRYFFIPILVSLVFTSFLAIKKLEPKVQAQQELGKAKLILADTSGLPQDPTAIISRNVNSNDQFDLNIYLYPDNEEVVALDIELRFDPQVLQVLGKTDNDLFATIVKPADQPDFFNNDQGTISLGAVTFNSQTEELTPPVSNSGLITTIHFQVNGNLEPQVGLISFDFTKDSSVDSNVVIVNSSTNQVQDILDFVNEYKVIIEQPGDINGDNKVDILDFYLISFNYGKTENFDVKADINRDGVVNLLDFYIVSFNYGKIYSR